MCEHMNFSAQVKVGRITKDEGGPVKMFMAEVEVKCVTCGVRMWFLGMPIGLSYDRPTSDLAATTANLPMLPEGVDFDPKHGLIGYSVHAKAGQ